MIEDYIHLEAFIKIEAQYKNVNIYDGYCDNGHAGHFGSKYCCRCGKKVTERTIVKKSLKHISELINNNNFQQCVIGKDVYIFSNNINVLHDLDDCLDQCEKVFIDIDSEFINKRIDYFKKNHKNDIKLLEAQIGKIEVQFGFLKYRR